MFDIFLSPRGITLSKHYLIGTQIKLDLHTLMMYLYTEFQFKLSKHDRDNEQKPIINRKSKEHKSDRKQIQTWPAYYHDVPSFRISNQDVNA